MVAGTFIREQTMSNVYAEPKPSYYELNEEELERVAGGDLHIGVGVRSLFGDASATSVNTNVIDQGGDRY
jgi:hypothetical protein